MDDAAGIAIARASRIFQRPERVVAALIDAFTGMGSDDYPGDEAVARHAYAQPIRMAATRDVFGLKARHWPMLNLLDSADRDRREFAAAAAAAVAAARRKPA